MNVQKVISHNGINVQNMFAIPLGWTFLKDVNNDELIEHCKIKLDYSTINIPVLTNGQSNKLDLSKYPIKNLVEKVTAEVNKFHKICGLKYTLKISEAWFNLGNPEIICKPHTHSYAFFVAIYYLNDSDVTLNFLNPINTIESLITPDVVDSYNEYNRVYTTIPPKEGLLIMHPAWITHYVNNTEDNRMSIAFNVIIDKTNSGD